MREKADSELVRRQNRRLVLDALREKGPLARIEVAHLLVADELQLGILEAEFVHHRERVRQIARDAVGDHAQTR